MAPVSFRRLSTGLRLGQGLVDALLEGDLKAVSKALKAGADPNLVLPEHGVAPLHLAAGASSEDFGAAAISALLAAGGDPNLPSSDGEAVTPLHVAAAWGRRNVLIRLLDAGGDPSLPDSDGLSALQYAIREGKSSVIEAISKHKGTPRKPHSPSIQYETGISGSNSSMPGDLALNRNALTLVRSHRCHAELYESLPGRPSFTGPSNVAFPDQPNSGEPIRSHASSSRSLKTFRSDLDLHRKQPIEIIHKTVPKKSSKYYSKSSKGAGDKCMIANSVHQSESSVRTNNFELLSDMSDKFSHDILLRYLLKTKQSETKSKKNINQFQNGAFKEREENKINLESSNEFSQKIIQSYIFENINEYIEKHNFVCVECLKKRIVENKGIQTDIKNGSTITQSVQTNFERLIHSTEKANNRRSYNPELRKVLSEVTEKIIKSKTRIEDEDLEEFTYDPTESANTTWKLGGNKLGNIPLENSIYPCGDGENSSANIRGNNFIREREICSWVTERKLDRKSGSACNNASQLRVRHFRNTEHCNSAKQRNSVKPVSVIWNSEEIYSEPLPIHGSTRHKSQEPTVYVVEGKVENFKDQFTSFNVVKDEEHTTGTKEVEEKKYIPPKMNKKESSLIRKVLKERDLINTDKRNSKEVDSLSFMKQIALASKLVSNMVTSLKSKEVTLSLHGMTVNMSPEKSAKEPKGPSKLEHSRNKDRSSMKNFNRRKAIEMTPRLTELSSNKRSKTMLKKKDSGSPSRDINEKDNSIIVDSCEKDDFKFSSIPSTFSLSSSCEEKPEGKLENEENKTSNLVSNQDEENSDAKSTKYLESQDKHNFSMRVESSNEETEANLYTDTADSSMIKKEHAVKYKEDLQLYAALEQDIDESNRYNADSNQNKDQLEIQIQNKSMYNSDDPTNNLSLLSQLRKEKQETKVSNDSSESFITFKEILKQEADAYCTSSKPKVMDITVTLGENSLQNKNKNTKRMFKTSDQHTTETTQKTQEEIKKRNGDSTDINLNIKGISLCGSSEVIRVAVDSIDVTKDQSPENEFVVAKSSESCRFYKSAEESVTQLDQPNKNSIITERENHVTLDKAESTMMD